MAHPTAARWVAAERLREPKIIHSVLDLIGDTPLIEIRKIAEGISPAVKIFAKLEGFNPGGSVKDRPALKMIQEGIKSGKLAPGKTIIDSTSGNTGIALAMIGRVLGERPTGAQDDPGGHQERQARAGEDHHRLHLGQYRHRAGDDRPRARRKTDRRSR